MNILLSPYIYCKFILQRHTIHLKHLYTLYLINLLEGGIKEW